MGICVANGKRFCPKGRRPLVLRTPIRNVPFSLRYGWALPTSIQISGNGSEKASCIGRGKPLWRRGRKNETWSWFACRPCGVCGSTEVERIGLSEQTRRRLSCSGPCSLCLCGQGRRACVGASKHVSQNVVQCTAPGMASVADSQPSVQVALNWAGSDGGKRGEASEACLIWTCFLRTMKEQGFSASRMNPDGRAAVLPGTNTDPEPFFGITKINHDKCQHHGTK
jgi:hypothetical protein